MLVARAGHPTIRSRVDEDASSRRFATSRSRSRRGGGAGRWPRATRRWASRRDIAVVVPTFTAAAAVVAGTDLVASLPASLVDVLGPRLALRRVATPLAPVTTTINLLWHERTHQDPALRAFRDLVARRRARRRPQVTQRRWGARSAGRCTGSALDAHVVHHSLPPGVFGS